MLIWVCALHCEAKPVIDFYRLKKSHAGCAFDLYRGDGMLCIVSGVGKLASAAASAWVAGTLADATALAWINLGVAGAAEHEIGTLFLLDKVVDGDSGQAYYPVPAVPSALPGSACLTLNRPGDDYREDTLFDMEASGYLQSALRFSSAELTQSLKIVSDNRHRQTGRDRQRVSELVAASIDDIDRQAQGLLALKNELAMLDCDPATWQKLLRLAHFTQTQKSRLRALWRYLDNRGLADEALLARLESQADARAIIRALEQLSHGDSECL